jgi:pimeloyl-ACP methyl ester carboxylesterase
MTAAQVNGIALEYEVFGEGEPMLLVMGLGAQLVSWPRDFVDGLVGRGFQVIRYDNRDIGLSTKFTDVPAPKIGLALRAELSQRVARKHAGYTIEDMADDGAALLDHLGIARAHVVGASMGGMIAQSLAIRHPAQVASLCSIMSNTGDRRHGRIHPSLLRYARALLEDDPAKAMANGIKLTRAISGPTFHEVDARAIIEESMSRSNDFEGTARQALAISASPDRTPGLRQLKVPTLVVHGLVDRLVTPSGGRATARAIPGSRLLMFPDMAHDLPRNRWDEIFSAIAENAHRADPAPQRAATVAVA